MSRKRSLTHAALGSAAFFLVAPAMVAGLVPLLLTGADVGPHPIWWVPVRVVGLGLIAIGLAVLVPAFVRFAVEGIGTPAPIAPTQHLVVGGFYRYVRNPMYLALSAIIFGQGLWFARWALFWYGLVVTVACVSFVQIYEEPALTKKFGDQYRRYRENVPGWWPRLRPWEQSPGGPG